VETKAKTHRRYDIVEAMKSYPRLPSTFDGTLPVCDPNRVEIGRTYAFGDEDWGGTRGRVVNAMVSEENRQTLIVVESEGGEQSILSRDMTDEELRNYREHPEAYFGVIQKGHAKTSDPYEFFEWLVNVYNETSKGQLLKLCRECEDFNELARLERGDLVLELCERWTASIIARQQRKGDASAAN
jgi:hypothetical protein